MLPRSGWCSRYCIKTTDVLCTRERLDESEGEGAPPRLIRAASDDALFERAVGRFDAPKGKSRPPFTSTGGEALPGETAWGEMNPWGDAKANCTIS